jgi:fused signal recognition particle receptor
VDPILIAVLVIAVLVVGGLVVARMRRTPDEISEDRQQVTAVATKPAPPAGLRARLGKTRRALAGRLGGLFGSDRLDDSFWSELEDSLVAADVGVATSAEAVAAVRSRGPTDGSEAREMLTDELIGQLAGKDRKLHRSGDPSVILVVGVNGGGKTTSIAKIAAQLRNDGSEVVLGAADTFRAAADTQLRTWADRVGVDVVAGETGADPASVAFDAYASGKAKGAGYVIVDTAGRLQNKANLMDELSKVARVLRREAGDIGEVLLVIDGTTGQNAISQAKSFTDAVGVTGIVITKLDGTARGGVAVAVERELDIPVKYIGVGEGVDDLIPFDPEAFVDALLGA